MANNRQTKRERRDMAKKARMEAQRRAARRRQLRRLYSVIGLALVIALVVVLVQLSGKSSREALTALNTAATAAGCEDSREFPNEGATHVERTATVNYKTSPPTSGSHFGGAVENTGVHDQPITDLISVHNLEHGHVLLQYKPDVPAEAKAALEEVAKDDPTYVLTAPNPTMTPTIAFTAWETMVQCTNEASSYTDAENLKKAAKLFVARYKDKAPESNLPGTPNE